jgi:hypothetical protein
MPTYYDLTQEVLAHQFSPAQYTTYVEDRLNQSLQYVCAQTDFEQINTFVSITVPASTGSFTLPTDFNRVQYLERQDGNRWVPLIQVPAARFDKLAAADGEPTHYSVRPNNVVALHPVFSSEVVVGLSYYRNPPLLDSALDVPIIPEQYHYMLVHHALKFCYERENDYTSAQYHLGQFQEALMKCRGEVHNAWNPSSQPRRIGDDMTDLADVLQGL